MKKKKKKKRRENKERVKKKDLPFNFRVEGIMMINIWTTHLTNKEKKRKEKVGVRRCVVCVCECCECWELKKKPFHFLLKMDGLEIKIFRPIVEKYE